MNSNRLRVAIVLSFAIVIQSTQASIVLPTKEWAVKSGKEYYGLIEYEERNMGDGYLIARETWICVGKTKIRIPVGIYATIFGMTVLFVSIGTMAVMGVKELKDKRRTVTQHDGEGERRA